MIWNIRQRWPDAAIYGITLHPADTIQRRGIPSYLLAGTSLPNYHVTVVADPPVEPAPADGQQPAGNDSVGRRLAKSLAAGAVGAARFLLPRGWPWIIRTELSAHHRRLSILKGCRHVNYLGRGAAPGHMGRPVGTSLCYAEVDVPGAAAGSQAGLSQRRVFRARRPLEPVLHPQGSFARRIQVVSRSWITRSHATRWLPPGRPGVPGPRLQSSVRWLPSRSGWPSCWTRCGCESVVPPPPSISPGRRTATIPPTRLTFARWY